MDKQAAILKYAYGIEPGMEKKAIFDAVLKPLVLAMGMAPKTLIAALTIASGVGAGTGWALAKANAHDEGDIDLAKKEYDNERLKADIGYLSGQLNQEHAARANATAPKPARVIA